MTTVLLVDDEALVRTGLRLILDSADDLAVVGEASDGREALAAVRRCRPDVVLMDIRMPRMDGLAATSAICSAPGRPAVIVLTTFDADDLVMQALRAGADGFLLKDMHPRELIRAVRVVARGDAMLSPGVTRSLVTRVAGDARAEKRRVVRVRLEVLTDREREVLVEVGRGHTNAEVAGALHMSEATVKTHLMHLFDKLGATNRVQIAIAAHDAGLLD